MKDRIDLPEAPYHLPLLLASPVVAIPSHLPPPIVYNSVMRSVCLRAVDVPTRSGASWTKQLRAVQKPLRAATSGSPKRS